MKISSRCVRLDEECVTDIMRYQKLKFNAFDAAAELYGFEPNSPTAALESLLFIPWSAYHWVVKGKPLVDWYMEDRGHRLSADQKNWLEAQERSYLTVWEVLSVEPGKCVSLRDQLTGAERTVHEIRGSTFMTPYLSVLARVVDFEGHSVFSGMHPFMASPQEAQEVVSAIHLCLGAEPETITPELLSTNYSDLSLLDVWDDLVASPRQNRVMPTFTNTDGDPLLMTSDHFDFNQASQGPLRAQLLSIEGARDGSGNATDDEFSVTFTVSGNAMHESSNNTVVGQAFIGSDGKLVLQSNSIRRAASLRKRVEEACGTWITFRARTHEDPAAALRSGSKRSKLPSRARQADTLEGAAERFDVAVLRHELNS